MSGGHIHPNITAEKLQELLSEPLIKKNEKTDKKRK